MHDFRKLQIWTEVVEVAALGYEETRSWPSDERFGLTSQVRAAAVSVGSNMAEGAGRGGEKDMARFLRMALGSLAVVSQLEMAARLGLLQLEPPMMMRIQSLRGRIRRLHNQLLGIDR